MISHTCMPRKAGTEFSWKSLQTQRTEASIRNAPCENSFDPLPQARRFNPFRLTAQLAQGTSPTAAGLTTVTATTRHPGRWIETASGGQCALSSLLPIHRHHGVQTVFQERQRHGHAAELVEQVAHGAFRRRGDSLRGDKAVPCLLHTI